MVLQGKTEATPLGHKHRKHHLHLPHEPLTAERHSTSPAASALGTSRYTWMWAEVRMPDLTASSPSSPAAKCVCRRDMRFRPPALQRDRGEDRIQRTGRTA